MVLGDVKKQSKKSELLTKFPIGLLVIFASEKIAKILEKHLKPKLKQPVEAA